MKSLAWIGCLSLALLTGCAADPPTASERSLLADRASETLDAMERQDPALYEPLRNAYGYAIFPSVDKGGLIAGGSFGRGVVYERDVITGYADISQATIGGQIGGQTYSELVLFEDKYALERLKTGKLTLETNLSAVALDRGTAQKARFRDGVIVFVKSQGGLMAEATIGGQTFTFLPMAWK